MTDYDIIRYRVMYWSLVFFILGGIAHIVLMLMPVSLWATWYDIYPLERVVKIGEPILMASKLEVKVAVDAQYNDILRCDDGSQAKYWTFHSDQNTKHLHIEPTDGVVVAPWYFRTPLKKPMKCYVESNIRLQTKVGPFGVEKTVVLNGSLADVQPHHFIEVME